MKQPRIWSFREARAQFEELVFKSVFEGPQRIHIYGKKYFDMGALEIKTPKLSGWEQRLKLRRQLNAERKNRSFHSN